MIGPQMQFWMTLADEREQELLVQSKRIEALEAALREIAGGFPGSYQRVVDMVRTAEAALASEQDK